MYTLRLSSGLNEVEFAPVLGHSRHTLEPVTGSERSVTSQYTVRLAWADYSLFSPLMKFCVISS